ncbi:MAG: serine/threonine-protein kinase, partial [Planctomycetota bacterium]
SFELGPVAALAETQTNSPSISQIPGYEIGEELHRGSQGIVYRAHQSSTNRDVAIKFLLSGSLGGSSSQRRFEREVKLVSGLSHPGIVPIFDSGHAENQPFFVMPLVNGTRLDEYFRLVDQDQSKTLKVFCKVCEAVGYAHQHSIVHRDLKPSNILVDIDGQPKVLDFGLAKIGGITGNEQSMLSMTGQIMGTLGYMSPEQTKGNPDNIQPTSDVYSLGVILYELVTQASPYSMEGSLVENLVTIQQAEPDPRPLQAKRVDAELRTIILKSLSKAPNRRYPSAVELGEDLRRHLSGEVIEARRDSAIYVIRKQLRRNWPYVAICVALLVGLVAGDYFLQGGADEPSIPSPLQPSEAETLYGQTDLEAQMHALQDLIRFDGDSRRIVANTIRRFWDLDARQFSPGMSEMHFNDLKKLKSLASFLADRPGASAIQNYINSINTALEQPESPKTSGLADELEMDVLEHALLDLQDRKQFKSGKGKPI